MSRIATLRTAASLPRARRARLGRRIGITALGLLVVAACLGLLGPRDVEAGAQTPAGTELTVRYPQITRPGLETELVLTVASRSEEVTVVAEAEALDLFGVEQIRPEPDSQHAEEGLVYLTFPTGRHDRIEIRMHGRLDPRQAPGRWAHAVGVVGLGAQVELRTWVLP